MYNKINAWILFVHLTLQKEKTIMKKMILTSCVAAALCFAVGIGSAYFLSGSDANGGSGVPSREDVVLEVMNMTDSSTVVSRSFYPNYDVLSEKLMQIRYGMENGILTDETLMSEIESARRELEQLGYYYDYDGKTSVTSSDLVSYGASADDVGPIGGGAGYTASVGTNYDYDFLVTNDTDFFAVMQKAKAGDIVFIAPNAVVDLCDLQITNFPDFKLPEGVIIASTRNADMPGGVLKLSLDMARMFFATSNIRITGVVIEGQDAETREGVDGYFVSNGIEITGTGIVIDNCEISGFTGAGIVVTEGDVHIHHCYIHHIRGVNEGNGILVNGGSATVEYNLFSNCRNAVAVNEGASLKAYNNVEVGTSLESMFRINGGESVVLKNNTVLGSTLPMLLNDAPSEYVVENNLFSLNESQYDSALFYGNDEVQGELKNSASIKNNAFNILEPYVFAFNDNGAES